MIKNINFNKKETDKVSRMGLRDGGWFGPGAVSRPTVGGGARVQTLQYKYKYRYGNRNTNVKTQI